MLTCGLVSLYAEEISPFERWPASEIFRRELVPFLRAFPTCTSRVVSRLIVRLYGCALVCLAASQLVQRPHCAVKSASLCDNTKAPALPQD